MGHQIVTGCYKDTVFAMIIMSIRQGDSLKIRGLYNCRGTDTFAMGTGTVTHSPGRSLQMLARVLACFRAVPEKWVCIALRVHVPKYYIRRAQCTYIGSTLRPKYILFGYMDP